MDDRTNLTTAPKAAAEALTYEVGYKRPPRRAKFPKGRSGNLKGRPKRPKGVLLGALLNQRLATKNGTTIARREILVHRVLNGAMACDARWFKKFMELMENSGLLLAEPPVHPTVIRAKELDPEPYCRETYEASLRKKTDEAEPHNNATPTPSQNDEWLQPKLPKPRKRRRKSGNENLIAIFKRLATKRITVMQDEQKTRMMVLEAILLKNFHAAQENPTAMNNIWPLLKQAGEFLDKSDPAKVGKPVLMPAKIYDTEELVARYGIQIIQR